MKIIQRAWKNANSGSDPWTTIDNDRAKMDLANSGQYPVLMETGKATTKYGDYRLVDEEEAKS